MDTVLADRGFSKRSPLPVYNKCIFVCITVCFHRQSLFTSLSKDLQSAVIIWGDSLNLFKDSIGRVTVCPLKGTL